MMHNSEKTRLMPLEEALTMKGYGWEEVWFEPDIEEGEPEKKELFEVAFIRGHYVAAYGDIGEVRPDTYNRPYHSRLWIGEDRPTCEQREAAAWEKKA